MEEVTRKSRMLLRLPLGKESSKRADSRSPMRCIRLHLLTSAARVQLRVYFKEFTREQIGCCISQIRRFFRKFMGNMHFEQTMHFKVLDIIINFTSIFLCVGAGNYHMIITVETHTR